MQIFSSSIHIYEVMTTLYSRGARNALFSLVDAEWHVNKVQPYWVFFIVLAMLRCVACCYQGCGLTLLESCRGCCWSWYAAKPEIGEENSASLMTSLDASRMYDLNIYILQDVELKTYRERWMMEMGGVKGSGRSMLIYIYIYIESAVKSICILK